MEGMKVTYWGVCGSIPAPLQDASIRQKQKALIKRIVADGGTGKLFPETSGVGESGESGGPGGPGKPRQTREDPIDAYLSRLSPAISGTYGGETTCVEIQIPDTPLIVLDAGTGIRHLGKVLLKRLFAGEPLNPLSKDPTTAREIHLFLSHYHWDHLQGFPFFGPGFIPGPMKVNIFFYGKKNTQQRLSQVLSGLQQCPNFPIEWDDMPCGKNFIELGRMESDSIKIGQAQIHYQQLTHPDVVFAYSVSAFGKKFIFATDTEHKDIPDPRLVKLARDGNALYYDSQYLPEEYAGTPGTLTGAMSKLDWGHSTYEWAVRNALAANVKTVVLGHHEPERDDFQLEALYERAVRFAQEEVKAPGNKGKQLEVVLAFQGLQQEL